jgi:hypothetical protein
MNAPAIVSKPPTRTKKCWACARSTTALAQLRDVDTEHSSFSVSRSRSTMPVPASGIWNTLTIVSKDAAVSRCVEKVIVDCCWVLSVPADHEAVYHTPESDEGTVSCSFNSFVALKVCPRRDPDNAESICVNRSSASANASFAGGCSSARQHTVAGKESSDVEGWEVSQRAQQGRERRVRQEVDGITLGSAQCRQEMTRHHA